MPNRSTAYSFPEAKPIETTDVYTDCPDCGMFGGLKSGHCQSCEYTDSEANRNNSRVRDNISRSHRQTARSLHDARLHAHHPHTRAKSLTHTLHRQIHQKIDTLLHAVQPDKNTLDISGMQLVNRLFASMTHLRGKSELCAIATDILDIPMLRMDDRTLHSALKAMLGSSKGRDRLRQLYVTITGIVYLADLPDELTHDIFTLWAEYRSSVTKIMQQPSVPQAS